MDDRRLHTSKLGFIASYLSGRVGAGNIAQSFLAYFLVLILILKPGENSRPFFSHLRAAAGLPNLAVLHFSFRTPP